MEPLITGALARSLERLHDRCNARFAEAKLRRPRLDPEALGRHLRAAAAPVAEAAAQAGLTPGDVDGVVDALFDVALDLVGAGVAGTGAAASDRSPTATLLWQEVLPLLPGLLAREPRRVVAALSNAAWHLDGERGVIPARWLDRLAAVSRLATGADDLLNAAAVAAWTAGMAHMRPAALRLLGALPDALARAALGLPPDLGPGATELSRRLADPWYLPGRDGGPRRLAVVGRTGGFRGFGGPFLVPPGLVVHDDRVLAFDDDAAFSLHADGFGAVLRREGSELPDDAQGLTGESPLAPDGTVTWGGLTERFPELAGAASVAATPDLLAVVPRLSHRVVVVAATGGTP